MTGYHQYFYHSQRFQDSQSHEPPSSQPPTHSGIPEASPEKRETIKKSKAPVKEKKRASVGEPGLKKRRKKDESDNMESGAESRKPMTKRPVTEAQKRARTSSSSLSQVEDEELEKVDRALSASKRESIPSDDVVAKSESEMSAVLDEAPKPKRQRRSAGSEQPKTKKTGRSKGAKATEQTTDPDVEEIKRLQGWLVKCGIRKLWHRELAPYDTAKAKIRHLKEMLTDAGMTGRFSIEKATQIREERELKADLEAVQAGAKQWGKAESDEEETGRPKRRLAKGLKELDFLNDDDGEETD